MNPVRFSAGPSRRRFAVLVGLFLAALHGWLVYFWVAYLPDISASIDDRAAIPMVLEILRPVSMVAGIAASLLIAVASYWLNGSKRNFLQLDQDGLRCMRAGKSRYWPWSVLPVFNTVLKYRHVQFVLPEGDTKPKRRDPWIHEVTPAGPVVAILDYYDAPFDEIAAELNKCRDRALGGAGAAGSD